MDQFTDILMITYNRPEYTNLALERLLCTCCDQTRVWLWHNGNHEQTLEIVRSHLQHPAVHRFHHSAENLKLREPTNWFLSESTGAYLSKVDDDCLMPDGWIKKLREVHELNPKLGIVGCWRFLPEDFLPEISKRKIVTLKGNTQLLRNCWVEGSGYLMKRECVRVAGALREKESFPAYCNRVALRGWVNGWIYPFLYQEHMDDPRTEHTLLKTDDDLDRYMPLSAKKFGARTLDEWERQLKGSARTVQEAPVNAIWYIPWIKSVRRRIRSAIRPFGLPTSNW